MNMAGLWIHYYQMIRFNICQISVLGLNPSPCNIIKFQVMNTTYSTREVYIWLITFGNSVWAKFFSLFIIFSLDKS